MTIGVILAVLVGTVGAAFVAGLSGFAFGMIGLSVWAWVLEPRLLSPMVVFGSLVAQLLIGGVMGGLAGLTGPVPTLWCTLRRWDKDVQRSVFQSFNLTMHSITLASYGWTGMLTTEVGWVFALMLPAILLPTWVDARFYQRISETAFRRLVLGLLLVSGCVLVGSSLVG